MKTLSVSILVTAFLGVLSLANPKERKIGMKDVPAAVKAAIEGFIAEKAKGATIEEIEVEKEKGRKVYEFELETADGTGLEVAINAKGKILEVEIEDDDDDGEDDDDDDD